VLSVGFVCLKTIDLKIFGSSKHLMLVVWCVTEIRYWSRRRLREQDHAAEL
jgi:hypothetical protein